MASRSQKTKAMVERYGRLFRTLLKSKRAIIGVGIIVAFSVVAILAPVLTPYSPVSDQYLAGSARSRAKPAWYRTILGDNSLSENMAPVQDPEFTNPAVEQGWNISTTSDRITVSRTTAIGTNGSGLVVYSRRETEMPETARIELSTTFNFPYGGPPARFDIPIYVLTENSGNAPVELRVFIEDQATKKRYEWGLGTNWAFVNTTGTTMDWKTANPPIASSAALTARILHFKTDKDLANIMIPSTGNYTVGLAVTFWDLPANAGTSVTSTVYIDKLDMKLYGSAFGLLGCDWAGRDIFSQLMYGTRISLMVGLLAAGISVFLGLLVGLVSGYVSGLVDETLMRFTDALLVLPGLPLLIVLIAVLGTSVSNIILILGFLGWMGFARVVRSQVLSLKERPFVEAAKAIGAGKGHIILKHIVPNVMSLVYVTLATSVPGAIVGEAALSWLGYFDPNVMSWGRMLNDVQTNSAYRDYWWVLPPGICIAAISVSFILLGYALDEVLNPRLRIRR